ncbi:hypothetical protein ACFFJY_15645 [Fictibacillus aquaticus]|uniref:Uncharacterized protein n=1 Tax=Fictibacillus aquaticus TaxID=2021314 RepID=A0A235FE35_9BACL|nr:hypothetical protein [Fictibacillus aquaticus]OYD59636.1 hypothetical protein CGZ90_07050 [Fictibacillus aquaticus]
MLDVQREIILASMLRTPLTEENAPLDFFVAYDSTHTPHLLLPTAKGLLHEGALFTIPFEAKQENAYAFSLSSVIQPRRLDDFLLFHDQLEFFFGPDHNMLARFLKSDAYISYVSWTQSMLQELIKMALEKWHQSEDETEKKKCKEQLTMLLNE